MQALNGIFKYCFQMVGIELLVRPDDDNEGLGVV